MYKIASRFLKTLAEVFEALEYEGGRVDVKLIKPMYIVALSIALTFATAFSPNYLIPTATLALSIILALSIRLNLTYWVKPIMFTAFWSTIISIPLIFMGPPPITELKNIISLTVSLQGVHDALSLILRTTACVAVFTTFVQLLGWRNWLEGLRSLRVPRMVIWLIATSIIYIPLSLRESSRLLLARESRMLKKVGVGEVWRMLSTVLGDLLLRGYDRAWRLSLSLRSRSFKLEGMML